MKIKSSARYELLTKALSEGKSLTEAAKEQGVSVALLSQIKKKYQPVPNLGVDGHPVGTVAEV